VDEGGLPDAEVCRLLHGAERERAFERLLARYQGKVLRLAMSYLGSRSDAEDLAQEAFVRVWRALPSYDGRASLSTWIYVIARNACLSELQRRKRRPTSPLDEAAEPRPHEGRPTTPPSDTRLDCDALLRTLPETQRQVVALFYLEERSYEQVAALLDMPLNTVRSHLHRARRHLALALGGRK
jgi:RNA polymerase sigma-70 factor (ECF subfamily)